MFDCVPNTPLYDIRQIGESVVITMANLENQFKLNLKVIRTKD